VCQYSWSSKTHYNLHKWWSPLKIDLYSIITLFQLSHMTKAVIVIIIITKLLLRQYLRKESIWVAHLVLGLDNLIVQVPWKILQQMIRWSGILGSISESEKMSFQLVTEELRHFRFLYFSHKACVFLSVAWFILLHKNVFFQGNALSETKQTSVKQFLFIRKFVYTV
jgi:hypothetical protein